MAPHTTTSAIPGSQTVKPYTYGLTGVDASEDNLSSMLLWASVGILFLILIILQIVQRANAHLRHLTSMGAFFEQERYWSQERGSWWPALKQNLLYAPLSKKRHNREIQLSKAINVGTLPSRLHTLILALYLLSNIIFCLLLDYKTKDYAALIADIRGRTGHLSVVNAVGLFVLAGRNNPLIPILGVSFDTFNLFHRWIGRIVILEAVAHTIAWAINENAAVGFAGANQALQTDPFLQFGLAATIAMSIIFVQTPSAIRHAAYEIFLHLHQALALIAFVGIAGHAKLGGLPQTAFVIFIGFLWSYDRVMRGLRILHHNYSFQHGLTKAKVEALEGEGCRVTFYMPRPWSYSPGTHAYLYFPSISGWMSHPFSIAWSSTAIEHPLSSSEAKLPFSTSDLSLPARPSNSISFVISKRTGMTAKLYDRAAACSTRTLHLTGLVEGSYGSPTSLHSYGTVLLFAGGVGITHQLGQVRELLAAHHEGTTATRKITLIWTVRSTSQLDWVRPWMNEILAMPGRREVLNLQLYITKPQSNKEVRSASDSVKMFPGRPKPSQIVAEECSNGVGAMVVGVCGPGAFADDVRAAVRGLDKGRVVDFWEEAFTW